MKQNIKLHTYVWMFKLTPLINVSLEKLKNKNA